MRLIQHGESTTKAPGSRFGNESVDGSVDYYRGNRNRDNLEVFGIFAKDGTEINRVTVPIAFAEQEG